MAVAFSAPSMGSMLSPRGLGSRFFGDNKGEEANPTFERELSLVFGGGGAFGIAWHLAVLAALRDAGFAVETAPAVGTSAGAWACAALRQDLGVEAFESVGDISVPDLRRGVLQGVAREIFGDAGVEDARISAVSLPLLQRRMYHAHEHSVADLVAASSAVPGLFAPHCINGVAHVDGGVRSVDSTDHAPSARLLIASMPLGGPLMGPIGRAIEFSTRLGLSQWRRRNGGETFLLRPGRRLARFIGLRPGKLFDVSLAHEVYPIAHEQVTEYIAARRHTLPGLVPLAA
jgi:hypothetical protein